jgi:delta14-sterol reductase
MEFALGFAAPGLIYALLLALHLVLPARKVDGYVRDAATGQLLSYRLNGLLVLGVALGVWLLLGHFELVPLGWLYEHRWSGLAGACTLGLAFSAWIVLRAPSTGRSLPADFFFGRSENPQFFGRRLDAKMFLYLVGAVMLALNLASFLAHHVALYGARFSPGAVLYTCLFFWFLSEYLFFERVHLYTYDIFAERVGFKLGWGCLTFYPYFYGVGLWFAVERPNPESPTWLLVLAALLFFTGWSLARGANMQKFYFKTNPEKVFLGLFKPEALSDGKHTLLCSGFWGVARHVNYLGEVLMATALTLSLGGQATWHAWLYPAYYVALLSTRQLDDDKRCAEKYGPLWQEYVRRVPRRIIPLVY